MQINQQVLQTLITIIIVLAAFLFTLYKVIKKIKHPVAGCNDCSSDCGGCELQSLKDDIDKAQKQKSKNIK